MSRPTKLTEKRIETIANALAEGESIAAAAHHAGISERTYHLWRKRGEDEQARLDATNDDEQPLPSEAPYVQFLQETARALATFEAEMIGDLKRVARGYQIEERGKDGEVFYREAIDWRAGAWLLERKFPDRYGARIRQEHTGEGGGPVQVSAGPDLSRLSVEDLRAYRELQAKAEGGQLDG